MLKLPMPETSDSATPPIRPQRLLKLISLLEGNSVVTIEALSNALGVCRRTVFRDVKLLRSANIPISFDAGLGGYCIRRDGTRPWPAAADSVPDSAWIQSGQTCRCPKIMAEEIAALLLALKVVGPLPQSILEACESALVKIMAAALPAAREHAMNMSLQGLKGENAAIEPQVLQLRPSG